MSRDSSNLVWIDLETTGLSVGKRVILGIASGVRNLCWPDYSASVSREETFSHTISRAL